MNSAIIIVLLFYMVMYVLCGLIAFGLSALIMEIVSLIFAAPFSWVFTLGLWAVMMICIIAVSRISSVLKKYKKSKNTEESDTDGE